jgi:hypothetical protein
LDGGKHTTAHDGCQTVEIRALLTRHEGRLFPGADTGRINQRWQLVYLPVDAGHRYNPTEKIWWHLKARVSANRGFKLLVELDRAIRRNLEALTPSHVLKLIYSPSPVKHRRLLPSNL